MKKNTNLSRLKIRWLNTQSLILMLFTFLFSIFGGNAQTYCVPQYSSGCTSGDNLNSFILTGHGASVLSDLNSGCNHTDGTGYSNRTSLFAPVDLLPGASYTVEMNTTYSSPQYELASIWIDLNSDGTFDDTTEKLLNELVMVQNPAFATGSISIPLSTSPGIYRMRVRLVYGTAGGFDACSSSSWGETHDYNVNILSLTPCSGTVVAGTAISTLTDACPGESFTLALSGSTVGGGITYQWQSLPAGAGTDRKSTRLNSSHVRISYAVFCLKKKTTVGERAAVHSRAGTHKTLPAICTAVALARRPAPRAVHSAPL